MAISSFFKGTRITDNILRIEGVLREYVYLVIGTERALLIDTGCGAGNIKEYVKTLTDLPLTVLVTHGHFDHLGGGYRFGEIYIGRKETKVTAIHYEARQVWRELNENGIQVAFRDMTEIGPIKYHWLYDGMFFDLGDTVAECIVCPGHTAETYAVLLKKERILLIGDACHSITYLFFGNSYTVRAYKEKLLHLKQREGEWDRLLLSHPVGEAPKEMLDEVIHVCDEILCGNTSQIPFEFRGFSGLIAKPVDKNMLRMDGKLGNIIYNPKRIY